MFFLLAIFGCVQAYAATVKDMIIPSCIDFLRDPAVLVDNGVYYVYGTDWNSIDASLLIDNDGQSCRNGICGRWQVVVGETPYLKVDYGKT